jgi:hypothetical protein
VLSCATACVPSVTGVAEQAVRQLLLATKPPAWKPDAEAADCHICRAPFRFTLRRHHCRHCGEVVCDPCSRGRLTLEHMNVLQESRVCDDCVLTVQVHQALLRVDRKKPLPSTPTHTVQPAILDVNRV